MTKRNKDKTERKKKLNLKTLILNKYRNLKRSSMKNQRKKRKNRKGMKNKEKRKKNWLES